MNTIRCALKTGLFLASCFALPWSAAAENALVNGDFELGATGWIMWGGQVSGRLQYKGGYGAGVYSSERKWRGLSQKVAIPDNARTFVVEGMMKTDEVIAGKEEWEKAVISIDYVNEVDSLIGVYPPNLARVAGTTDWTKYSRRYSVDFTASYIKIVLALGNATGSAQFDNISLVFYDENGKALKLSELQYKDLPLVAKHRGAENKLLNGDFEEGTSSWQASGEMIAAGKGVDESSCLRLGFSESQRWASQMIPLPQNVHRIVVTGSVATENVVQGDEFWKCATISGEFLSDRGVRVGDYLEPTGKVSGTESFREYLVIYPSRTGASSIKITCGMNGESGIALFDNLKVSFFDVEGKELK